MSLLPFEEARRRLGTATRSYRGIQQVPLDRIIGSVDRSDDFDRHFHARRAVSRQRLDQLRAAVATVELPAIVVFEVGGAYFVEDGHHRVALAREQGAAFIDAEVTSLITDYVVEPGVDVCQLLHTDQHQRLLDETGLVRARPDADIRFTLLDGYTQLRDIIDAYGYQLSRASGALLPAEQVAALWYGEVYQPGVEAVRRADLPQLYASWRPTDGDLFLWVYQLRRDLRAHDDHLDFDAAARHARSIHLGYARKRHHLRDGRSPLPGAADRSAKLRWDPTPSSRSDHVDAAAGCPGPRSAVRSRSPSTREVCALRAVLISRVGEVPTLAEVPEPVCPLDGVVVAVRATGLCRSDWHAWLGHEDIALPHVPGHEFAGVIDEVGTDVSGWSVGDRVTAPFVYACGRCGPCRAGDQQVCDAQEQPGFTRWGSFAERVVVTRAQTNLVRLPPGLDFAAAAALGCRFATAYRAVVTQGRLAAGETLVVHGCGGVGLSAIQIGAALGARVVGVDPSPGARAAAEQLGARSAATAEEARAQVGGAHVAVDAYGSAESAAAAYASLGKRGRHIQVGLLVGDAAFPRLDLARAIAEELEIRGSHGMAAHEYPEMLARMATDDLDPGRSIGRRVRLEDLPAALAAMSTTPTIAGTIVAELD